MTATAARIAAAALVAVRAPARANPRAQVTTASREKSSDGELAITPCSRHQAAIARLLEKAAAPQSTS